ncbi:Pentatricopeptide repeat-containing protein [Balamuthia mandrillaris]
MLRLPRAMDHPKPFPMQRWLRLALVPGGHHLSLAPPSCKYHTSFRLHDTQTPDQRKQKRRSKAKTRNRGTASTGEGESQAEARASRNFTQQLQKLAKAAGRLEETAVSAVLEEMERAAVRAKDKAYTDLLKRCREEQALLVCQRLHAHLLSLSPSRPKFSTKPALGSSAATLISTYGRCGRVDLDSAVFDEMPKQAVEKQEVGVWNALIQTYTQRGHGSKALALFHQMQQASVAPDAFTFSSVLKACATEKDLEVGKQVHAQLLRQRFLPDVVLSNALISMYGKCGQVEDARAVFQEMKERNIVTWNSMIAAYGGNGQERKALATFDDMLQQGMQPDVITFKLLNAYNQARLVEEGASCFAAMREKHAVQPAAEHYNRMVDLLGRTGRGKEAETLLNSMDVAMRPLLANDGNDTERAGRAAQEVEIQNTKKVSQIFDELFGTSNKK